MLLSNGFVINLAFKIRRELSSYVACRMGCFVCVCWIFWSMFLL